MRRSGWPELGVRRSRASGSWERSDRAASQVAGPVCRCVHGGRSRARTERRSLDSAHYQEPPRRRTSPRSRLGAGLHTWAQTSDRVRGGDEQDHSSCCSHGAPLEFVAQLHLSDARAPVMGVMVVVLQLEEAVDRRVGSVDALCSSSGSGRMLLLRRGGPPEARFSHVRSFVAGDRSVVDAA